MPRILVRVLKRARDQEYGTHKTVTAKFRPWLEPLFRQESLKHFNVFLACPGLAGLGPHSLLPPIV